MKINVYDDEGELWVLNISDENFIKVREYAESIDKEVSEVLLSLILKGIGGEVDEPCD